MSAKYLKQGNVVRVIDSANLPTTDVLAPGNYIVKWDKMMGYHLESISPFVLPTKMYGNTVRHRDRVLNTFKDRNRETGVLLTGDKGSGKSLLAKAISVEAAAALNMPTIVVTSPFCDDDFFGFVQRINQPCVLLFEEFEKIYKNSSTGDDDDAFATSPQEKILTLLDGAFPSNKLFVFTCNNKYQLNENLKNRPGRMFYHIEFSGMTMDAIREYCAENMKNKTQEVEFLRYVQIFPKINFDMVKAIVEDANRYPNDPISTVFEMINAKPTTSQYGDKTKFDVEVYTTENKKKQITHRYKTGIQIEIFTSTGIFGGGDYLDLINPNTKEREIVYITDATIVDSDFANMRFVCQSEGYYFILTKKAEAKNFSPFSLLV